MANPVMAGGSSGGSRYGKVIIDRFEGRYLLPADHHAPERTRAILDDLVIPALESALSVLGPQLASSRESEVWLIRRLEIEVDVNTAWGRDELARQWGWQIARRLFEAIRDGGDGHQVIHFPNRAAYFARFVVDLAANNAWGQWYYRHFEGLRLLPASSAIRTALTDDPATGLSALLILPLSNLAAVLRAMSVADARRVLEQLSTGDEEDEMRCLEVIWKIIREYGLPGLDLEEPHQALQLFVMAYKEAELAGPFLGRVALALAHLGSRVAHSRDTVGDLVAALESRDIGRLHRVAGARSAEILTPLLAAPAGFVGAVISIVRAQTWGDKWQPANTSSEPELYTTPFGGAFVLAPLLDRLPLDNLIGDWPGSRGTSFTALLRFLLLVVCLGADRSKRGFQDPALRNIMAVDRALAHWDLTGWLTEVGPARMGRLCERLIDWWLEDGAIESHELFLCSVPARGGRVALLVDAARGIWLSATGYSRSPAGFTQLMRWLQHGPLAKLPSGAAIYAETEFVLPLQKAQLPLRVVNLPPPAGEVEGDAAEILARLDRLQSDLAYLLLPAEWKVPRTIALEIAVLAMGILRDFAWRLPGFARSGLPYLYRNFLDFSATFEVGPEQYTVRVGRPPLHLVLNMTGMSRGMAHLSWLDRPLVMTQEG